MDESVTASLIKEESPYKNMMIYFCLALSLLLRCMTAGWPYSGQGTPPMYGDYEAQRHWMEITSNLPVKEWYRNSSDNNLNYWGLDYPPLTAYHMWISGNIANQINPSWMQLKTSRGHESPDHKIFMRTTVIVSDVLFFFSALLFGFWTNVFNKESVSSLLLYPGLILIDHGHFQYNCVSLGLTLWAIVFLNKKKTILASIAFSLAINYKQISMYHSLAFFFYILGSCFKKPNVTSKFLSLCTAGTAVVGTFAVCWLPFLSENDDAKQVLSRVFPVSRGLFEDKVANFWCSLDVIIKLRKMFPPEALFKMSAIITVSAALPSSLHLLLNPSLRNFKYSLVISSMSFFLFSFQVHEKGILLVALPACLLMRQHTILVTWLLVVTTFR
jgi:alpha-1,3-glucosyltransferase